MRIHRSPVVLLLATGLLSVLLLAGCGGATSEETGDTTSSDTGTEQTTVATAADVRSALSEQYGDEEWFQAITAIEDTVKLRHPVLEIYLMSEQGGDIYSYGEALSAAMADLGFEDYHCDIYVDGVPVGGFGNGGEESVTLPPAPASIDELPAWMDEAYGPANGDAVEEWYEHITGYDFETDAYDGDKVIVATTDLPYTPGMSPESEMADLIRYAISSSGLDWATTVRVVFADGDDVSSGDLSDPASIPYRGY